MPEKQPEVNGINGHIRGWNADRVADLVVLRVEDKSRFQAMLNAYMAELRPVGIEENDFVGEIAIGKWRQNRFMRIESAIREMATLADDEAQEKKFTQVNAETQIALAMTRNHGQSEALIFVGRYKSRASRFHRRARRQLDDLQSKRRQLSGRG